MFVFGHVLSPFLTIPNPEMSGFRIPTLLLTLSRENIYFSRQWMYQTCTEFGWYQSSNQPGKYFVDLTYKFKYSGDLKSGHHSKTGQC